MVWLFYWVVALGLQAKPVCPEWINSPSVPPCPTTSHLSEDFPPLAHVFSAAAIKESRDGKDGLDFAKSFLNSVVRGSGDRIPLLFLPMPEDAFAQVKAHLGALGLSKEKRETWEKRLIHVGVSTNVSGNDHITFQQDHILGFYNPKSGKFPVRHMQDRPGSGVLGPKLAARAAELCPKLFEVGTPIGEPPSGDGPLDLPPSFDTNLSPNFGGNVTPLPGGLCLRGNNQGAYIARQYCEPKDEVVVDVNWLHVGHVDEVFGVVPHPTGKCPALVRASPARAMELMAKNADQPFLEFPPDLSPDQHKTRMQSAALKDACEWAKHGATPAPAAADATHGAPPSRSVVPSCRTMTNGEVLRGVRAQPDVLAYQKEVERVMERETKKIVQKMKARLGCEPKVVRAPNLFRGGPLTQGKLPAEMGKSLLPNPANLVALSSRVLSPHPYNGTFLKTMSEEFEALGLNGGADKSEVFLDTFVFGHMGNGNLHCAVQTFRGCRK